MEKAMLYLSLKAPAERVGRKAAVDSRRAHGARDSVLSILVLGAIALMLAAGALDASFAVLESLRAGAVRPQAVSSAADAGAAEGRCGGRQVPRCGYRLGSARW